MRALRIIYFIYLGILTVVPGVYASMYLMALRRFEAEAEKDGKEYFDCTGMSMMLIPVTILITLLFTIICVKMVRLTFRDRAIKILRSQLR